MLTQTTLSVDDTRRSIESIQERFPSVIVRNDLCYATTNRQAAVKELCERVDVVLVIGAANSSNCKRLREVAEAHGRPAYLIDGPEELRRRLADRRGLGGRDVGRVNARVAGGPGGRGAPAG